MRKFLFCQLISHMNLKLPFKHLLKKLKKYNLKSYNFEGYF